MSAQEEDQVTDARTTLEESQGGHETPLPTRDQNTRNDQNPQVSRQLFPKEEEHVENTPRSLEGDNISIPLGDHAHRPETDQARRPLGDHVCRPETDQARRPLGDHVCRPETDQARRPLGDHARRPKTDQARRPLGDHARRPKTGLVRRDHARRPETDEVRRPLGDHARRPTRPAAPLVTTPAVPRPTRPAAPLVTTPAVPRPTRPAAPLVTTPTVPRLTRPAAPFDQARRPLGDHARRPETDQARRPLGDHARRPETDLVHRPLGDHARRPETDQARRPLGDHARRPETDLARRPLGDHARRPETDQARRPDSDQARAHRPLGDHYSTPEMAPSLKIQCKLQGPLHFTLGTETVANMVQEEVRLTLVREFQCTVIGSYQCENYLQTQCKLKSPLQLILQCPDLTYLTHFYNSLQRYKHHFFRTTPLECSIPDYITCTCTFRDSLTCTEHGPLQDVATPITSRTYRSKTTRRSTNYAQDHDGSNGVDTYTNTHIRIKPRLLYHPQCQSVGKHFENYFANGVNRVEIHTKCWVNRQVRLKSVPRIDDDRGYCQPDAVFVCGMKGAVVDMKNYDDTKLTKQQVDKTYKDMWALAITVGCWPEKGYIYVRKNTHIEDVEEYATKHQIYFVKEGDIDADELVTLICTNLKTDTGLPHCHIWTYTSGDPPAKTLRFYPPGKSDDEVMRSYLDKLNYTDRRMTDQEIKRWEDILEHSEPPITPMPLDPTVFIFTKVPK